MTRSNPNDFATGLVNAMLLVIPLWGAMWFGAVYAVGKFMADGGHL